jgi:hypothetical protein
MLRPICPVSRHTLRKIFRVTSIAAQKFPSTSRTPETTRRSPHVSAASRCRTASIYEDAAEAFRDAQKADASLAVAYWLEALTYSHVRNIVGWLAFRQGIEPGKWDAYPADCRRSTWRCRSLALRLAH